MDKREIKFRCWSGNQMHEHWWLIGRIKNGFSKDKWDDVFNEEGLSIMQYTGLDAIGDKNIYEDDIVDVCIFLVSPANPDDDQHFRGIVTFEDGCFKIQIFQYRDYSYNNGNLVPLKEKHLPFECELDEDGTITVPLYDFMGMSGNMGEWIEDNIGVVGNIHQNPELLQTK